MFWNQVSPLFLQLSTGYQQFSPKSVVYKRTPQLQACRTSPMEIQPTHHVHVDGQPLQLTGPQAPLRASQSRLAIMLGRQAGLDKVQSDRQPLPACHTSIALTRVPRYDWTNLPLLALVNGKPVKKGQSPAIPMHYSLPKVKYIL